MMQKKRIWIDMVTAPDVPFFSSIINECKKRGCFKLFITGRKYLEVPSLVEKYSLEDVTFIDCFYGKSRIGKIFSLILRTLQLCKFAIGKKINLAFGFASRSQTLAGWLCGIPVLNMIDYEGGEKFVTFKFSKIILIPEEMSEDICKNWSFTDMVFKHYPGIKESTYAHDFTPDPKEIIDAGIPMESVIIVVRMNSTLAHYHTGKSIEIDMKLISYLGEFDDVACIVLPRYQAQREIIKTISKKNKRIMLLNNVVNGQNLIWHSDAIISGGGSMIREAVCLGVPAYDIFDGPIGAVERSLIDSGEVIKLNSEFDFQKIAIRKATVEGRRKKNVTLLNFIVDELENSLQLAPTGSAVSEIAYRSGNT